MRLDGKIGQRACCVRLNDRVRPFAGPFFSRLRNKMKKNSFTIHYVKSLFRVCVCHLRMRPEYQLYLVLALLGIFSLNTVCRGEPIHVHLITVPPKPTDKFVGIVDGADFGSNELNPCYQVPQCYIAAYVISKDWLPNGKQGYTTFDITNAKRRADIAESSRYMGVLLTRLRDEGLLYTSMTDYLPANKGKNPTFCMFAGIKKSYGELIAGTRLSNCADAPPIPSTCHITNQSVDYDWGDVPQSSGGYSELELPVGIVCSSPARVKLSVSGASVPLNGDSRTRAEFNLGEGWIGATSVDVFESTQVVIRARLVGMNSIAAGYYSGSSIIILEII